MNSCRNMCHLCLQREAVAVACPAKSHVAPGRTPSPRSRRRRRRRIVFGEDIMESSLRQSSRCIPLGLLTRTRHGREREKLMPAYRKRSQRPLGQSATALVITRASVCSKKKIVRLFRDCVRIRDDTLGRSRLLRY